MDVRQKLDEVRTTVEKARAMPMSASCVVNRSEVLDALSELGGMFPTELAESQQVLSDRQQILEQARGEATRMIEDAKRQREAIVHDKDAYRAAQEEAEQLRGQSQHEAEELRRETDDYVDQKLAGLEVAMQKTLATLHKGRDRLAGMGSDGRSDTQERKEVDQFVMQKLAYFEDTLRKGMDSVGRGRERLRDRSHLDDYGAEEDAPQLPE